MSWYKKLYIFNAGCAAAFAYAALVRGAAGLVAFDLIMCGFCLWMGW